MVLTGHPTRTDATRANRITPARRVRPTDSLQYGGAISPGRRGRLTCSAEHREAGHSPIAERARAPPMGGASGEAGHAPTGGRGVRDGSARRPSRTLPTRSSPSRGRLGSLAWSAEPDVMSAARTSSAYPMMARASGGTGAPFAAGVRPAHRGSSWVAGHPRMRSSRRVVCSLHGHVRAWRRDVAENAGAPVMARRRWGRSRGAFATRMFTSSVERPERRDAAGFAKRPLSRGDAVSEGWPVERGEGRPRRRSRIGDACPSAPRPRLGCSRGTSSGRSTKATKGLARIRSAWRRGLRGRWRRRSWRADGPRCRARPRLARLTWNVEGPEDQASALVWRRGFGVGAATHGVNERRRRQRVPGGTFHVERRAPGRPGSATKPTGFAGRPLTPGHLVAEGAGPAGPDTREGRSA